MRRGPDCVHWRSGINHHHYRKGLLTLVLVIEDRSRTLLRFKMKYIFKPAADYTPLPVHSSENIRTVPAHILLQYAHIRCQPKLKSPEVVMMRLTASSIDTPRSSFTMIVSATSLCSSTSSLPAPQMAPTASTMSSTRWTTRHARDSHQRSTRTDGHPLPTHAPTVRKQYRNDGISATIAHATAAKSNEAGRRSSRSVCRKMECSAAPA